MLKFSKKYNLLRLTKFSFEKDKYLIPLDNRQKAKKLAIKKYNF